MKLKESPNTSIINIPLSKLHEKAGTPCQFDMSRKDINGWFASQDCLKEIFQAEIKGQSRIAKNHTNKEHY